MTRLLLPFVNAARVRAGDDLVAVFCLCSLSLMAGCGVTNSTGEAAQTPIKLTATGLSLSPQNASLQIGATQPFSATATYSDGSTKNVTNAASWSSSYSVTARIDGTGSAIALTSGVTDITATVAGLTAGVPLFVQMPTTSPSVTLDGNSTDPHLMTTSLSDGTTLNFFGHKDSAGLATNISSLLLTHPNGNSTIASFDPQGRATTIHGSGGGTVLLKWDSSIEGSITAISPDGKRRVGPAVFTIPASSYAHYGSAGRLSSILTGIRAKEGELNRGVVSATSNALTSVVVSRCSGRPVQDASVILRSTSASGKDNVWMSSGQSQPGVYDFYLPLQNPTPGLTPQQVCDALDNGVKALCSPGDYLKIAELVILPIIGSSGILLPEELLIEMLLQDVEDAVGGTCTALESPAPTATNPTQTSFETACQTVASLVDNFDPDELTLSPSAFLLETSDAYIAPPQVVPADNPTANFNIDAGDTGDCGTLSVGVTPNPASVAIRSFVSLTAQAYDGDFVPIPDTFKWNSTNTSVAQVDQGGFVTGITQGNATVTASAADGVSGKSQIHVGGFDRYIEWEPFVLTDYSPPAIDLSVNGVPIGSGNEFVTGARNLFKICAVPDGLVLTIGYKINISFIGIGDDWRFTYFNFNGGSGDILVPAENPPQSGSFQLTTGCGSKPCQVAQFPGDYIENECVAIKGVNE